MVKIVLPCRSCATQEIIRDYCNQQWRGVEGRAEGEKWILRCQSFCIGWLACSEVIVARLFVCGISQVTAQPAIMRVFQNMASSIYMYTLVKNHIEVKYNYAVATSLPTCAMLSRISSRFTSLMPIWGLLSRISSEFTFLRQIRTPWAFARQFYPNHIPPTHTRDESNVRSCESSSLTLFLGCQCR